MKLRNTIILGIAILSSFGISSCSSDNDNYSEPIVSFTKPNNGGDIVKTIDYSGNFKDVYSWKFSYSYNGLSTATGVFKNGTDGTNENFGYNASISYFIKNISISSVPSSQTASTSDRDRVETKDVVLGNNGLISSMKVGQYNYNFSYNSNGYLIQWRVSKSGTGLPGTNEISTSTGNLSYDNNRLSKVVYINNDAVPNDYETITFEYDENTINFNGLLPEGIIKEIGFFGFEYLYYAGAFGKCLTPNMLKSANIDFSDEKKTDYQINYNYARSGTNITDCYFNYSGNNYSSAKYGY